MRGVRVAIIGVAAACLVLIAAGSALGPHEPAGLQSDVLSRGLSHWDASWYVGIASVGYWYEPGEQSPVVYFPAYPLAIRALSFIGVNPWVAGSFVTLVCGLAALALFRRWAQHVAAAGFAVWFLALYPFAFYLYGVIYADAFFLVFGVGAFLALERGRPGLSALLGAVATLARPAAPAIVIGLLVRSLELRKGQKLRAIDFVPALAGCGLLAYMLFLGVKFDDPLAFAHAQAAPGWDNAPGWRTWLKVAWFETMFPRVAPLVAVRLGGHALVTLCALALVVPTWKRLGRGYGAYVAVAIGLPALSSHDFQGLGRYVLAAFPLFVTVALLLNERPRLRRAYLAASALLLAVLAAGFGAGGYVA